jgi:hypothetical protein
MALLVSKYILHTYVICTVSEVCTHNIKSRNVLLKINPELSQCWRHRNLFESGREVCVVDS